MTAIMPTYPNPHPNLAHHSHRRLQDCGGHLCSHYAEQLLATGEQTTTEQAFGAWLKWVYAEGGKPQRPLLLEEASPVFRAFHERAAIAIRETSRYTRESV